MASRNDKIDRSKIKMGASLEERMKALKAEQPTKTIFASMDNF